MMLPKPNLSRRHAKTLVEDLTIHSCFRDSLSLHSIPGESCWSKKRQFIHDVLPELLTHTHKKKNTANICNALVRTIRNSFYCTYEGQGRHPSQRQGRHVAQPLVTGLQASSVHVSLPTTPNLREDPRPLVLKKQARQ